MRYTLHSNRPIYIRTFFFLLFYLRKISKMVHVLKEIYVNRFDGKDIHNLVFEILWVWILQQYYSAFVHTAHTPEDDFVHKKLKSTHTHTHISTSWNKPVKSSNVLRELYAWWFHILQHVKIAVKFYTLMIHSRAPYIHIFWFRPESSSMRITFCFSFSFPCTQKKKKSQICLKDIFRSKV